MESEEAVFDIFALGETGHRVIDPTGETRAVKILMFAGPCISNTVPNAMLARIHDGRGDASIMD